MMEARFVPRNYQEDLRRKLFSLKQGSQTVDEYYKEMELLMLRADFDEDDINTMYRFLEGLRRDIRDAVELCHYTNLQELLQLSKKVEAQQRAKTRTFLRPSERPWQPKQWGKENERKPPQKPLQPVEVKKSEPKWPTAKPVSDNKARDITDVVCYKCRRKGHYASACPNLRIAVLRDDGYAILSDNEQEQEEGDEGSDLGDEAYDDTPEEVHGEQTFNLIVRRTLSVMPKSDDVTVDRIQEQRDNLFHCQCEIQGF